MKFPTLKLEELWHSSTFLSDTLHQKVVFVYGWRKSGKVWWLYAKASTEN